ncbi:hypothetical protein [Bradyrhizobium sp. JYMT SZCCT0428]|uniref:hypothetical protein n=1 Tax=Bradyrhizobium sp. JYMT SZCCT0428 TaxID=2807673 RepID=UPI001BA57AE6|nr:hypothetical protein [Bradyrhizobium sp. JYMT SZCCT0428]MBR1154305.1 hypothetical protein [Bradyrhizobium sp. JYMT SZCCT0428]
MMLDINYLVAPPELKQPVIYRYRTGILIPAMHEAVRKALRPGDEFTEHAGGLFDQFIPFWEWRERGSNREMVRSFLRSPPNARSVFFAHRRCPLFRHSCWPEISATSLIVEETNPTEQTVEKLVSYLDHHATLGSRGRLSRQGDFIAYFRELVMSEDLTLNDFVEAFNEAVVCYVDRDTGDFERQAVLLAARQTSIEIARHLERLLEQNDQSSILPLVIALAKRHTSSDRRSEILSELGKRASMRLSRLQSSADTLSFINSRARASLIFVGSLIAWAPAIIDELTPEQAFGYQPRLSTNNLHQMLSDTWTRLTRSGFDDPFNDLWSDIRNALNKPTIGPLTDLVEATATLLASIDPIDVPWARHFRNVLVDQISGASSTRVLRSSTSEETSVDQLLGTASFLDFIKSREARGRRTAPLVLAGPVGSGKQTLARYSAMFSACAGAARSRPCFACEACTTIAQNGSFDYVVFDVTQAVLDRSIEEQLRNRLDMVRASFRVDHSTLALLNFDQLQSLNSRYLKTLENGADGATWIFCVEDVASLNPAIVSRSDVWHVRPLNEDEATTFAVRELSARNCPVHRDPQAIALIVRAAQGLPGRIKHSASLCAAARASDLVQVRSALGFHWTAATLALCEHLLGSEEQGDQCVARVQLLTIERMRLVLAELELALTGHEPHDAAFLYLPDDPLSRLAALVKDLAGRHNLHWRLIWTHLLELWTADEILEIDGLAGFVDRSRRFMAALPSSLS